ncbi:MAG: anti-sigma factor antagonist [Caldithrix sp.]|nr:MAG: anti-sigma factor antagonist [Caldithrix sp.]TDI90779.1 MAG: anti-sigma factor antagonist [Caldithrix sp.]
MKLTDRMIGDVAILDLSGKLLGGPPASDEIRDKIYALIDQGITKVVMNLADVSRMNSSGLGLLIQALTSLRNKEGNLKLAGINELMEGVLVMTKLDTIFETHPNAEAAAESF